MRGTRGHRVSGAVVAAVVVRLDDVVAVFAPMPTQRSR
jgi:hypothetical protein